MNRSEALKIDTEFYADLDEKTGLHCVFGNNSGFAYSNSTSQEEAEQQARELNNQ